MESSASWVQDAERVRTILWLALGISILVYVVVASVLFGLPSISADAFTQPGAPSFVTLAVASAIAGRALSPMIFPERRFRDMFRREVDAQELAPLLRSAVAALNLDADGVAEIGFGLRDGTRRSIVRSRRAVLGLPREPSFSDKESSCQPT